MVMHTRVAYSPGDQVYNTYGMKTNAQLLLYYGFVLEGNPFDTYHFKWKLADSIPQWKKSLLSKYSLSMY
jgi:hypothetical protein